jgi:hypothetical protein
LKLNKCNFFMGLSLAMFFGSGLTILA